MEPVSSLHSKSDWKVFLELLFAVSRKVHDPTLRVSLRPTKFHNSGQHCAAQTARKMRPALTPIQAMAAQWGAFGTQTVQVNAEPAHKPVAFWRQGKCIPFGKKEIARNQTVEQLRSQITGQVVIADPRLSERQIPGSGTGPKVPGPRRQTHKTFQDMGYISTGKGKILVPTLFSLTKKTALFQPRQMGATGLDGNPCLLRQFGCRQRLSAHQRRQHVCTDRVAD